MSKTKNAKVFAMVMLTALLMVASSACVSNVKAATTTTLFLYTTLGAQSVMANGTQMMPGTSNTFNSGDTEQFTATASSGFQFLCYVYADANGPVASTSATYTKVISAACSLEAVFIPTTNTTATASGSGTAALTIFATSGGTTSPAGSTTGASVSAVIGHTTTLTQTPGGDYKFLCWVTQCSSNSYYTSSTLDFTPTEAGTAIEAIWVPTSSSVTLPGTSATPTPKVPEFSAAMVAILALALVAAAFGTYAYTRKAKN